MNRKIRKSIAALGITSLLVVGAASAQEAPGTPDNTTPDARSEVPPARAGRGSFFADLILEYTGLDASALRAALRDGSTLAELIEANGQSVDGFIAAILAEYDAQAIEARASFEERLTEALNGEGGLRFGFGGRGGFGGRHEGMGRGDRGPRGRLPGYPSPAPETTDEAPAESTTT